MSNIEEESFWIEEIISSLCRLSFFFTFSEIVKNSFTLDFSVSFIMGSHFTLPSRVQNSSSFASFFSLEPLRRISENNFGSVSERNETR